jgi:hypothetical protein
MIPEFNYFLGGNCVFIKSIDIFYLVSFPKSLTFDNELSLVLDFLILKLFSLVLAFSSAHLDSFYFLVSVMTL